jgi:hypothetical protein
LSVGSPPISADIHARDQHRVTPRPGCESLSNPVCPRDPGEDAH